MVTSGCVASGPDAGGWRLPWERGTGDAAGVPCVALPGPSATGGLGDARLREIMRVLMSTSENSSLDWRAQASYIEYNVEGNPRDNRGYTAGIVGFTTRTGDLLKLAEAYTAAHPRNPLAPYLPALRRAEGSPSASGLGDGFVRPWRQAARDPAFVDAQVAKADAWYYDPAISRAVRDGLGPLGQFAYADSAVMHGVDGGYDSFTATRERAAQRARPPAAGGDETAYLRAFLTERKASMRSETAHADTSRVDDQQRRFLDARNLALRLPLRWSVYGDAYAIVPPGNRCPAR